MSKAYRIPTPILPFQPPVYACRHTDKPFVLDGNIHKDFWADIPFTDEFQDIEGPTRPTPRFSTRAKVAWDDENLYFSALLIGDEIWAHVTERDDVIFRDNDFEIFLDPDSDTQQYYEFEMNARNTIWDLLLTKAYRDGGKPVNAFDIKGIRTAVHIEGALNAPSADNRFWSVEVVMPFTSLMECSNREQHPLPGDYWRLNFSRVQWKVDIVDGQYQKRTDPQTGLPLPEDNWVWAPTGVINIHYPELWGFLFFVNGDEDTLPSIPQDEYRKAELRTLYYLENHYLEDHGHYTDDPRELGSPALSFPYQLETTSRTFLATCRNADDTGVLFVQSDGKCGFLPDGESYVYL